MMGKHAEALGSLAEAIKLSPNEAWIRAMRGMSLLALGEHEQGINEMYLAVQIAPDDPRLLVNFGMALGRFGARAGGAGVDACDATRSDVRIGVDAAGGFAVAAGQVRRGVSARPSAPPNSPPTTPPRRMALGNASQQTAQFDQAAASYRRAVALDPKLFGAQHNLALTLWKMGAIDESIELFDAILARLPDATEAKVDRAFRAADAR